MEETKETTKKTTVKKSAKPAAKTTKTTTTKKSTKPAAKATRTTTTTKKSDTTKKATNTVKKPVVEKKVNVNANSNNVQEVDAFAAISLILGIASLITWLYPILGVSIAIPGLSIGIVTHETRRSNYSLLGIVMSLVGIILSIIKAFSM